MPLPKDWATPKDFATLFQYMWHRDFPMSQGAIGARRATWTIHIGVAVRNMADLMGLVTRFERGGRKDAILRSFDGDEVAIEWEWDDLLGNELKKLKNHHVWSGDKAKTWSPVKGNQRLLKCGMLITYIDTPNIGKVCEHVTSKWKDAEWPLVLILIDFEESKKFPMGRDFKNISAFLFDCQGKMQKLRESPAFPWKVECSRWAVQTV